MAGEQRQVQPKADRGDALAARYRAVRARSQALAAPLGPEDCAVQSMADASPVKWHLAHTTWLFETVVLVPHVPRYQPFDPAFRELFNSYYNAVGAQFPRAARACLTRPDLATVLAWRGHVDAAMAEALAGGSIPADLLALGLAHEEQHQELILTDVKHLLFQNPLRPAYAGRWALGAIAAPTRHWVRHPGGLVAIGHEGADFAFDNEGSRHRVWLEPFALASHPVTNGEWAAFIDDGGYRRPELWLAAGWDAVATLGWTAPLYWERVAEGPGVKPWRCFTLHGMAAVDPAAPVAHISFYEADAFARWAGYRLPTEAEWEVAAMAFADGEAGGDNVARDGAALHPLAPARPVPDGRLAQMIGDVWEWTASPYRPYPGFRPADGVLAEYNGKFMSGQMVLRGGSCATPAGHVRPSYRNFFPADARWQFSGLRLARDGGDLDGTGVRLIGAQEVQHVDVAAIHAGLMADPPRIASAHFYDPLGCRLFEAITALAEYYPTRTEAAIMARHGEAISAAVHATLGEDFQIVDLGAGNCAKGETLIGTLRPSRYIAVDVAAGFLADALARVAAVHPGTRLVGIGTDFGAGFALPADLADRPTLYFWPGSSIGNFARDEAARFVRGLAAGVRSAALLLGVDLVKDGAVLQAAYDDAAGVTAAFNRNILAVLNRAAGTDFVADQWRHVALWNAADQRIEMWLEAISPQDVRWPGGGRVFPAGSRILTEISAKYSDAALAHLWAAAGSRPVAEWRDDDGWFAVPLVRLTT